MFSAIRRNFLITLLVFLSVRTSSRVLRSERTNRSNRRNSDNRTSEKKTQLLAPANGAERAREAARNKIRSNARNSGCSAECSDWADPSFSYCHWPPAPKTTLQSNKSQNYGCSWKSNRIRFRFQHSHEFRVAIF